MDGYRVYSPEAKKKKKMCLTLDGNGDDEDANGGPDERAGVTHGQQALALDELRHLCGEVGQVRLHVVL